MLTRASTLQETIGPARTVTGISTSAGKRIEPFHIMLAPVG